MHIFHATDGGEKSEFKHLREIQNEIFRYMLGNYITEDAIFTVLLEKNQADPDELLVELLNTDAYLYVLYDQHEKVFSYSDEWIAVVTEDDDRKIVRYILKLKTEKHIETIEWV